jgi:hypothetical protein
MPNARERKKADAERLKAQREKQQKEDALAQRQAEIKGNFPTADARCKEALKCPHADYPEMNGASVADLLKFFDVAQGKYYGMKHALDAALATAEHEQRLASMMRRQQMFNDQDDQEESALYSGGESAANKHRILEELKVCSCNITQQ